MFSELVNKFSLDDKPLHKQKLFLVCLFLPLGIGLLLAVPVWWQYKFEFSGRAFNFFLEISKLPLSIMALSPIVTAFVVNAHRTIQTSKQIELLVRKNTQDEFYSHYKYINEAISSQTMKVYVCHDDDFISVSIERRGEVNHQSGSKIFEFSCWKPQLIYHVVFDKCKPHLGVSFERNMKFIEDFKHLTITMAAEILFINRKLPLPNDATVLSISDGVSAFKNGGGVQLLSTNDENSLMHYTSNLMNSLFISSDSIYGMDIDKFMGAMDVKSMAVFSSEAIKLYLLLLAFLYEEGELGEEFRIYAQLAINISQLFEYKSLA